MIPAWGESWVRRRTPWAHGFQVSRKCSIPYKPGEAFAAIPFAASVPSLLERDKNEDGYEHSVCGVGSGQRREAF